MSFDNHYFKLVIPARHRTIFALTINGTSDPSFYYETITFKTRYEVKKFHFLISIVLSYFHRL
jgi:hypothetical protein